MPELETLPDEPVTDVNEGLPPEEPLSVSEPVEAPETPASTQRRDWFADEPVEASTGQETTPTTPSQGISMEDLLEDPAGVLERFQAEAEERAYQRVMREMSPVLGPVAAQAHAQQLVSEYGVPAEAAPIAAQMVQKFGLQGMRFTNNSPLGQLVAQAAAYQALQSKPQVQAPVRRPAPAEPVGGGPSGRAWAFEGAEKEARAYEMMAGVKATDQELRSMGLIR